MMKQALRSRHYPKYLEWAYRNIEPLILIEEFKSCKDDEGCPDYKFFCFLGEPRFCQVDMERFANHRRNLFDVSWRFIPVRYNYDNGRQVPKPSNLDAMIHICRKLSQDFDFVRVDLYSTDDKCSLAS